MLKKWLSLGLCVLLLLSLTACGGGQPQPHQPEDENYVAGMAKLEEGKWQEAYDLFKLSADPKAAEMLEKFVFVPVSVNYKQSTNSADYTITYTYDAAGNLLEEKATGKTNWYTKKDVQDTYTYDEHNRMLSHVYRHGIYETKETYTYDKDGNTLSHCYYNSDGVLSNRTDYTYDARGNILTAAEYDNLDAAYNNTTVYTYDEQDRILTQTVTGYSGNVTVYTYTYDEAGNYQRTGSYYKENDEGEKVAITYSTRYYDSAGRSLGYTYEDDTGTSEKEEIRRNERGDEIYRHYTYRYSGEEFEETVTIITYDEAGHLLTSQTTADGEISSSTTYTYDEAGNELTYDYFNQYGSWGRRSNTYDEQGHLLTRQEMGQWGWTKYTFTYDEAGNCIKEEKNGYNSHGNSDHTYDSWGNRTEYRYYGVTEDGEIANTVTAVWDLKYYPEGVPAAVNAAVFDTVSLLNG